MRKLPFDLDLILHQCWLVLAFMLSLGFPIHVNHVAFPSCVHFVIVTPSAMVNYCDFLLAAQNAP